ncbi:hypothetical protein NDU88_004869 [Pleurodeles waltl]|uniref:Uncharacterized protein n=1 Tax=Pleurodeles waltl TaxID=8319 RepID=A0AAV7UGJ8_PLEWA|nr:hypothetical protein NDU88_004869 [Pleurodeles waltl]
MANVRLEMVDSTESRCSHPVSAHADHTLSGEGSGGEDLFRQLPNLQGELEESQAIDNGPSQGLAWDRRRIAYCTEWVEKDRQAAIAENNCWRTYHAPWMWKSASRVHSRGKRSLCDFPVMSPGMHLLGSSVRERKLRLRKPQRAKTGRPGLPVGLISQCITR